MRGTSTPAIQVISAMGLVGIKAHRAIRLDIVVKVEEATFIEAVSGKGPLGILVLQTMVNANIGKKPSALVRKSMKLGNAPMKSSTRHSAMADDARRRALRMGQ